ncbi:class I SAM-dependent methyltransferase [Conexibacter stalactiti]|uniref:Class I SAM-dependent methyltransferase n=1 Tax=Conexibacter stalactiti TaxID=1940611 RepID=A0ABU4HN42_9ACTN|nr:class I SAM-dependent methyltransferase [Conexibacter stalactiti]MDW5593975.1 class I SAM-dependent methyltransferase [Conexibacter stalactiti]MEC5034617.1 class I SAM-dependent methyltransferase [Conexibacter stalactiti]
MTAVAPLASAAAPSPAAPSASAPTPAAPTPAAPHSLIPTAPAFAERVTALALAGMEATTIHLGRALGLYAALHDNGPQTAADLAGRTETDARYVREWLEQQASAAIVTVVQNSADPHERRFALPPAHAEVLLDPTSLAAAGALTQMLVAVVQPLDRLIEAFRTGAGIPYDVYPLFREAQAEANRPLFEHQLAAWIAALPDLHKALSERGGRIADVACGGGWSTIALARAYPRATVDGYDADAPSIALARANLRGSGVEPQVRFRARAGEQLDAPEPYDLVTIFEAVHDMADPVDVLAAARRLLAPGGVLLVADEKTAHEFAAPGDELERLFYAYSVLFCLPTGREHEHAAATGTVMRPATMARYATDAGFTSVQVLDGIEHDLWRFYLLVP